MNISAVSKDIHENISRAIWMLDQVEIRYVEPTNWTRGVPICAISDDQVRELKRILGDHGIRVSMLATTFGCGSGMDKWGRQVEVALALETKHMRIHAFGKGERSYADALAETQRACEAARQHGLIVAMENGAPDRHAHTPKEIEAFLRDVGAENLHLCWDPAEQLCSCGGREADFAEARDIMPPLADYVHVKDVVFEPGARFVCVGQGLVGYEAIFDALTANGYRGFCALEPHYGAGDIRVLRDNLKAVTRFLRDARRVASTP